MLDKLIKYDMKSLRRVLLPLMLAIPVSALLCTAALRLLISLINTTENGNILTVMLIMTSGIFILANAFVILACPTAALVFTMVNFYRSLYTDEGYLTFTLPVKTSEILNSKYLTAVIWGFIAAIVSLLSGTFVLLFGTSTDSLINYDIIPGLADFFGTFIEIFTPGGITIYLIQLVIAALYQIIVLFLAITIGSVIVKKFRALASIGIYYAINVVVSTVTSIISFLMMFATGFSDDVDVSLMLTFSSPVINSVLYLGFGVAAYITCLHLMKNKLDLS